MMISIYALLDPDTDEVRYVGKTFDHPKFRYYGHCVPVKKLTTPRDIWVAGLMSKGKLPKMVILEETDDSKAEQRWINHYRNQGARLTNGTNFGIGRSGVGNVGIPKDLKERVLAFAVEQSANTGEVVSVSDVVTQAIEMFLALSKIETESVQF